MVRLFPLTSGHAAATSYPSKAIDGGCSQSTFKNIRVSRDLEDRSGVELANCQMHLEACSFIEISELTLIRSASRARCLVRDPVSPEGYEKKQITHLAFEEAPDRPVENQLSIPSAYRLRGSRWEDKSRWPAASAHVTGPFMGSRDSIRTPYSRLNKRGEYGEQKVYCPLHKYERDEGEKGTHGHSTHSCSVP